MDSIKLTKEILLRKLEREKLSRMETEKILEQKSLELFQSYQSTLQTLNQEHSLLQQYKAAVDETAIVSKSNKSGFITYVNKAFCEISEYSEDELIGKPHSLLRHPEMPKWLFKDMWKKISSKQRWNGQLKNLSKSGRTYYVDTTIIQYWM